ncbi:septal ring lytic transglycosylase RlpA family protein [Ursidibacter sp. B-7004-1]
MHLSRISKLFLTITLFLFSSYGLSTPKKDNTKTVNKEKTTLVSKSVKKGKSKIVATKTKKKVIKSQSKKAKSVKNETKKRYGVKGASLAYTKVSNKKFTYREKGQSHTTINKEDSRQYGQVGTASYYGGMFHGRKTASGEIYNKNGFTAAHKTLALGSYALVTNLRNGRKVIVRINDRGPFSHSRVIDLSVGAAREIGMIHSGVAKVRIEALQVDKQGYISGKGAQALLQLAKKEGLPLKIKGEGDTLAIKAQE